MRFCTTTQLSLATHKTVLSNVQQTAVRRRRRRRRSVQERAILGFFFTMSGVYLVFGKNGWLGGKLLALLKAAGKKAVPANSRLENREDVARCVVSILGCCLAERSSLCACSPLSECVIASHARL